MMNELQFTVRLLTEATPAVATQINRLIPQLSTTANLLTWAALNGIVHDPRVRLLVAELADENRIIGFIVLHVPNQISAGKGWAEDLVVDEPYRRQGVAKALLGAVVDLSRELGLKSLNTTTSRATSQALSIGLGFNLRRSMLLRMDLKSAVRSD
jgi:GNAT superfamily N-acetyltransferase